MFEKRSKCWPLKNVWGKCRTISSCTVKHFPSHSFPGIYKFKKVPEKAWAGTSETSLGRRPILHSVTTNLCVKQLLTSSYRLHQKDLISHNSKTWRWFGVISLQIKEEIRKKADVLSLDILGPFPFNEPSLVGGTLIPTAITKDYSGRWDPKKEWGKEPLSYSAERAKQNNKNNIHWNIFFTIKKESTTHDTYHLVSEIWKPGQINLGRKMKHVRGGMGWQGSVVDAMQTHWKLKQECRQP